MENNPFALFNIDIPKKYQESVQKFSKTSGKSNSVEYAPFERQVDFWFMAFLIGVNKKLPPEKITDTYNATTAAILDRDPYRISFMRLCFLGLTENIHELGNDRKVFDYCLGLANAGMPHLIQILNDPDDRPLWSLLGELEVLSKSKVET